MVILWKGIELLVEGVDYSHPRVTFVVFWSPVYQLGCSGVDAFQPGGAVTSKVSLLATVKACTLYSPLSLNVICFGDVSSTLSPPLTPPVSSWGYCLVKVHQDRLVVPGLGCSHGVKRGLSKPLPLLLRVWVVEVLSVCLPGILEVHSLWGVSCWSLV